MAILNNIDEQEQKENWTNPQAQIYKYKDLKGDFEFYIISKIIIISY